MRKGADDRAAHRADHEADELNIIIGQSHFIKSVEDLHEALVNSVPGIPEALIALAQQNALAPGAGHGFIVSRHDHDARAVGEALEEHGVLPPRAAAARRQ